MMIDDHAIKAKFSRFGERLQAGDAAIDRDQNLYTTLGEGPDGLRIRSIAFENTVRDMDDRIQPAMPQVAAEQCRCRAAVDTIVAEDGNAFAADDGIGDAP